MGQIKILLYTGILGIKLITICKALQTLPIYGYLCKGLVLLLCFIDFPLSKENQKSSWGDLSQQSEPGAG